MLELCEEEFIAQCFEEMLAAEEEFEAEVESYLEDLSAEQLDLLVQQMDAVALGSGGGWQGARCRTHPSPSLL